MARRFEFRLERVRALRERAEDEAKEHLAAAMAERERRELRRRQAAEQLAAARSALRSAASGGVSVTEMLAHQSYLERAERALRSAELEVDRQDAEVEARRLALVEAARRRQVLERLKEKQRNAFVEAAQRAENAELDELALSRHRRAAS